MPPENEILDLLARSIRQRKCALVLGPYALTAPEGPGGTHIPLRAALAADIAAQLPDATKNALADPYDLPAVCSAFMETPNASRSRLEMLVEDFYTQYTQPGPLLQRVAGLPFHLALSVNPDTLLESAYRTAGHPFDTGFYRFKETQTGDYPDDPNRKYIFQLFGRVSDTECEGLVLTQRDQMEYIDSMQGVGKETRLPTSLRQALQRCTSFLFIGFDFDYWYLRVLLHILQFGEKADTVLGLHHAERPLMPSTQLFFRQQFRFSFVPQSPMDVLDHLNQRLNAGRQPDAPTLRKKVLYLYDLADEALRDRFDQQMYHLKVQHGLAMSDIHRDVSAAQVVADTQNRLLDEADLVVALLSPAFAADARLLDLLDRAKTRLGAPAFRLAGLYLRPLAGAADLLRPAPLFPAPDRAVTEYPNTDLALQLAVADLDHLIRGMA